MTSTNLITLLPLGTCAGDFNPYQAYSSYLLMAGSGQILLDAGSWRLFFGKQINYSKLRAIFLTHGHDDHVAFLGSVLFRSLLGPKRIPLHIYYPTRWTSLDFILRVFLRIFPKGRLILHPITPKSPCQICQMHLDPWNVRVSWSKVIHPGYTLGYRFDFKSSLRTFSLAYTPDTSFFSLNAGHLARNADYWMLDSTFSTPTLEGFYWAPYTPESYLLHSSPGFSALLAKSAGVKTYIIAHFYFRRYPRPVIANILRDANLICKTRAIVAWDLHPIRL
ncbi:MAG TPA: MBL fold metallo-hydrolase [Candidatus Lokiarchaeia archaeon]|nr:MBL fold metallo-hydrolase [Candidatus Lokiarchaeia archaeon]